LVSGGDWDPFLGFGDLDLLFVMPKTVPPAGGRAEDLVGGLCPRPLSWGVDWGGVDLDLEFELGLVISAVATGVVHGGSGVRREVQGGGR
jgi:hypothetical protein